VSEKNEPGVTATEVVLSGKVEPSGLRLVERALPAPTAGQALVRVESTAVSAAESAMRRDRYYGQPEQCKSPLWTEHARAGRERRRGRGVRPPRRRQHPGLVRAAQPHRHAGLLQHRRQDRRNRPGAAGVPDAGRETRDLELPATGRRASFYNVWAGAGKPGSAKRTVFQDRTRTDLTYLFRLLRAGVLIAKIAARFPLTEVAAALELGESSGRTAVGKIILVP
jgi:NADPH:quinone reductase-like Zn-dependent oxidoreductase